MTIFLLSGYKRSGKDTAAQYLIEHRGMERRAFADSLKDDVAKFLGISRSHMDDPDFKEKAIIEHPVNAFDPFSKMNNQFLAKEFRTSDGQQPIDVEWLNDSLFAVECDGMYTERKKLYWTPRAACIFIGSVGRTFNSDHWVDKALPPTTTGHIVVSDFRYKSEYSRVVDSFGAYNVKTVRIDRFDSVNSTDPSETNLDDFEFDIRINNKGSLEEFYNKLKGIY